MKQMRAGGRSDEKMIVDDDELRRPDAPPADAFRVTRARAQ